MAATARRRGLAEPSLITSAGEARVRSAEPRLRGLGSIPFLAFVVCLLATGGNRAEGLSLEEANRRWQGADCTLRIPMRIRKKPDRNGWYLGSWVSVPGFYTVSPIRGKVGCPSCAPGELPFSYLFMASNRDALRDVLRGRDIPAGTAMVAEGWRASGPQGAFALELRFADHPAQARFDFAMKAGEVMGLERLAQVEQFMRVQLFELMARDEQLVSVDPAGPTAVPPPATRADEPPPSLPEAPEPAVRVISASVDPPSMQPGDETELLITYEVSGVPPGAAWEVVELREIRRDEETLTTLEDRFQRASDSYTTSHRIQIPDTVRPGIYRFHATVRLLGLEDSAGALFEVR